MKDGYLVFLDSGIGGMTTMRAVMQRLPAERYAYFCDSQNVPYGNKSDTEILERTSLMMEKIARYPVKAVVMACNTITAVCGKTFRARYPYKIFGIEPALRPALLHGGKTLVLATTRTILSMEQNGLSAVADLCALPFLAGEIERSSNPMMMDIRGHLPPNCKYQNVVLGCTHYPLVVRQIAEHYDGARIWDGNEGLSKNVASWVLGSDYAKKDGAYIPQNIDFSKIKLMFEKDDENRLKSQFYRFFVQKY